MINAIIKWSIEQRVLIILLSVIVVIIGGVAVKQTPVDAIPDLSDVQVIIKTTYPGQSPSVVQDQVTFPITSTMLSVPGATTVRGFSFFQDSFVYVLFEEGTDIYWARSRVLEYLNQVTRTLPDSASSSLGPDATGVGWVYQYALVDRSGKHDLAALTALQDWFLKYELQSVEGVSEVAKVGGMVKEYQVIVDPIKLKAFGVPLRHIETAIKQGNTELGASVIELAEAEYMVTVSGYLSDLADFGSLPLGIYNANRGVAITLSDVADIRIGPQKRRGVAELNGEGEVVGATIVMRFGDNPQRVIQLVKDKLRSLQSSLPKGVEIVTVYDRSTLIDGAIGHLQSKLIEEIVIVALVCFAFLLHVRSSLVAIVTIPVGILMAFIIMRIQGLNANIMSLGGIAIAIGAMVDGAIVMIENLHQHIEKDQQQGGQRWPKQRWKMVLESSQEVAPALFFSLLIITVSFVPIFTLEAQEGKLFAPLAYTKTYAMAAAAILAITLVPVLMGYFIRGRFIPEYNNPLNRLLIWLYRPVLSMALRFPKTVVLSAVIVTLSSVIPMSNIGSEFMPTLDEGDLMYMPTTYPGISIAEARQILQQTNKLIKTIPEVDTVFGKVGRSDTATDPAPLSMIETLIRLKPKSQWRSGIDKSDIENALKQTVQLPGLTNAWVMPIKTRIDMLATGIKTPVGIKVAGPQLDKIQQIGNELEELLTQIPTTQSVYSEKVVQGRYLNITLKRDSLNRYGLSVDEAQQLIALSVGGKAVSEVIEGQQRYPISIRYTQALRSTPEQLFVMPILVGQQWITLGDIAEISLELGPPGIRSENARLNGLVYVDVADESIGQYIHTAQRLIDSQLKLPVGYSLEWAGQYEYMERAKQKLNIVVPLTVALIIVLLFLSFGRVVDVALILITLPLALTGGIWLLYLLEFHYSVAVAVGFIALAGVAVEIGVIMLVYLNQQVRRYSLDKKDGEPMTNDALKEAIISGSLQRVRPIMMTAISIIAGLIPILLGQGVGSEVMTRVAAPMVGGMTSALLLTLIVLPTVFYWYQRYRNKSSR